MTTTDASLPPVAVDAATTAPADGHLANGHGVNGHLAPLQVSRKPSLAVPDSRMEVRFKNISYSVTIQDKAAPKSRNPFAKKPTTDKDILKNVSGIFKPGRMTAIMGASGAGKTSLLQVIAGEARSGTISGNLLVNGLPADPAMMKQISGFVFQDDVILQTMTVREALTMAAVLRLPKELNNDERVARVEEIMTMLKLEKAADVVVGDSEVKGISGGERKRLAVGMELVNNPSLLFLDEFSSGLDAFTAKKVGEILLDLARSGRTVVSTIHQPSAELFYLFDDLLLLAEGQVVYHGPVDGTVAYFESIGFKIPPYTNPIDWIFLNVLSVFADTPLPGGPPGAMEPAAARIARVIAAWPKSSAKAAADTELAAPRTDLPTGISDVGRKSQRSTWVQLEYLTERTAKNARRNKLVLQAKAGQSIVFGLLLGLTYFDLPSKDPAAAVQNYSGVLFFLVINQIMMNAMSILNVFGEEKAVFRRENGAGYYNLASFFMSKLAVEVPLAVGFAWLMNTLIYFMVRLPINAGTYFIVMAITSLCAICGMFIGIALASSFESLQVALVLTPMILLPLMLFSGLFINSATIPPYFDWIKYLSPMKWGFEALIVVVVPQYAPYLGLSGLGAGPIAGILIAFVVFLLAVSYVGLWRVTVSSRKKAKWVDETGKSRTIKKGEMDSVAVKAV